MADYIESLGISSIEPSNEPPPDDDSFPSDSSSDSGTDQEDNLRQDLRSSRTIHGQRNEARAVEPMVISTTHASFRLSTRPSAVVEEEEEWKSVPFDFEPGEKPMPPSVRARSVKALKTVAKLKVAKVKVPKEPKEKKPGLFSKCKCHCNCFKKKKTEEEIPSEPPATELSPELQKANSEGLNMAKTVAFPSTPALLQDLWVYLELLISILAFALGMYGTFPIEDNLGFTYTQFMLTVVNMVLALIDGYVYFIEIGSCARAIQTYKSKILKKKEVADDDDEARFQKKSCCKPEVKEKIFTFFELGRNVLTELLLYPLLVFDLFSFEGDQIYFPSDIFDRLDYGLFIIGSFYLILAVYIMRLFVLFGSVLSLIRLPSERESSTGPVLLKFSIHAIGQIFVHLTIIILIGAKINTENSNTSTTVNSTNVSSSSSVIYSASPFLWVSIILGWLLPLAGTASFFIVNYYWIKEFSIDFWLNMMSLLQGASFAETVFGGDDFSETKDSTLDFIENNDFKKVSKQLEKFKSPSWWTKFFYPARVPSVALCGLLYDTCLIAFIVSLMFTHNWELVIIKSNPIFTGTFFISVIVIIIANLHILLLLNILLIMFVLLFLISVFVFCFIILPFIILYIPVMGLMGYSLLLRQLCSPSSKKKNVSTDELLIETDKGVHFEMKEYI